VRQPLTTRLSYGTSQAEAKLPEGGPTGKGLSLEDVSGQRTFAKPLDDTTHYQPVPPEVKRKRVPPWDSWVDDEGYGQGATDKTKYPYRDGIPNTHNASATFVVGLYSLEMAPRRLFRLSEGLRHASTVEQILGGLDPKIQQKADTCSVSLKRVDKKNLRWIFSVDCGNGAKVVKLKAIRPKANITKLKKMDLELSCSCPAWRWIGPEYHAKSEGFLLGKPRGTATTPNIRDPKRVHRVCKHVAAVLGAIENWVLPKPKSR
jgi:hypothetical protein